MTGTSRTPRERTYGVELRLEARGLGASELPERPRGLPRRVERKVVGRPAVCFSAPHGAPSGTASRDTHGASSRHRRCYPAL